MIGMPKPKPTSIIRHEIVLGRTERDMLDPIIASMAFKNMTEPIVEILKDGTALLALAGILEAAGVIDFIPDDLKQEIIDGVYETVDAAIDAIEHRVAVEFGDSRVGKGFKVFTNVWAFAVIQGRKVQNLNPLA
jgi:hypothetical protein